MSRFLQSGNLRVMSDPYDDLCDSVWNNFVEGYRKRQQDKWNNLTNTRVIEEGQTNHWRNVASGSDNTGNDLIHSQSNFPDLS